MTDIEYSREKFKHLRGRAIIPLVSPSDAKPRDANLPDMSNVQGDVVYLFPKRAENFVFFHIKDVGAFKTALRSLQPTTSEDVKQNLDAICTAKSLARDSNSVQIVSMSQRQIASTRMGLNVLGVKENTGDKRFDNRCMRDDKTFLGDQRTWDPIFDKKVFDEVNGSVNNDEGALHGVITIAACTPENCDYATEHVILSFKQSIIVAGGAAMAGRARPYPYKGHEHFGYEDGVSQPALCGLVVPYPGQVKVNPGVILMGYPGDPVLDNPNAKMKRPPWTKDGTIMVLAS